MTQITSAICVAGLAVLVLLLPGGVRAEATAENGLSLMQVRAEKLTSTRSSEAAKASTVPEDMLALLSKSEVTVSKAWESVWTPASKEQHKDAKANDGNLKAKKHEGRKFDQRTHGSAKLGKADTAKLQSSVHFTAQPEARTQAHVKSHDAQVAAGKKARVKGKRQRPKQPRAPKEHERQATEKVAEGETAKKGTEELNIPVASATKAAATPRRGTRSLVLEDTVAAQRKELVEAARAEARSQKTTEDKAAKDKTAGTIVEEGAEKKGAEKQNAFVAETAKVVLEAAVKRATDNEAKRENKAEQNVRNLAKESARKALVEAARAEVKQEAEAAAARRADAEAKATAKAEAQRAAVEAEAKAAREKEARRIEAEAAAEAKATKEEESKRIEAEAEAERVAAKAAKEMEEQKRADADAAEMAFQKAAQEREAVQELAAEARRDRAEQSAAQAREKRAEDEKKRRRALTEKTAAASHGKERAEAKRAAVERGEAEERSRRAEHDRLEAERLESEQREEQAKKDREDALRREEEAKTKQKEAQARQKSANARRAEAQKRKEAAAAQRAAAEEKRARAQAKLAEEVRLADEIKHMSEEDRESVTLPEMPELTSKSEESFDAMILNISRLKSNLNKENEKKLALLSKKSAACTQNLSLQKKEAGALVADNAALVDRKAALEKENSHLRDRARKLQQANDKQEARLQELAENISYAAEFVEHAMVGFAAAPTDDGEPKELKVLTELAGKDAKRSEADAKLRSLDEVAEGRPASLLAIGNHTVPHAAGHHDASSNASKAPSTLLATIGTSLADFRAESEGEEASAQDVFLVEFAEGAAHLDDLQHKKESLQAEEASLEKLQLRLGKAVTHLEGEGDRLNERVAAAEAWMARLGHSPLLGGATHGAKHAK